MHLRHHWYLLRLVTFVTCAFTGTLLLAQAPPKPGSVESQNQRIPRQRSDMAGIIGRVQGKNAQLPAGIRVVLTNRSAVSPSLAPSSPAPKNARTEIPADADGIFRAALPSG